MRYPRQLLRVAVGLLISLVAAIIVIRSVSAEALGQAIRTIDWRWVVLILLGKTLLILLKYVRWRTILRISFGESPRAVFTATTIGYFTNLVVPMKLGELLRAGVVARNNRRLATSEVFATIAAERLIDLSILVILASAVSPWMNAPEWLRVGTLWLMAALASIIFIAVFRPLHNRLEALLPENKLGGALATLLRAITRGTVVLRSPRGLLAATSWTTVVWLVDAGVLYCATRSVGAGITYGQSIFVILLFALGLTIPSAPVQLGTHQAMAVFFLTPIGATTAEAVTISIVLQTSNLIVLSLLGGSASFHEINRWRRDRTYGSLAAAKISADNSGI